MLPCVFGMSTRYSSRKSIGAERDKDLIIPRIHTRTRAHAGAHAMSKKSTTRPPIPLNRQRYNGLTGGRWLCPDALRPPFDHQLTNYWAYSHQIQPHSYQRPTTFPPSAIIWVTNTKATSAPPSSANMAYRHRSFATSKTRSLQVPLHQDLKFTMTWDDKYKRTVFVKKDNLPKQIDLSYIPEWPVDWNGKAIDYTKRLK